MLDILFKDHEEWVSFTKGFTTQHAEDIVQDMYLRVSELPEGYLRRENDEYKKYIRSLLRNRCEDVRRRGYKFTRMPEGEPQETNEGIGLEEIQRRHEQHQEIRRILCESGEHGFYYENIYLLYTHAKNPSLRTLEQESGIPYQTIGYGLRRIKEILKDRLNGERT